MRLTVERGADWTTRLVSAIAAAKDGDEIDVYSPAVAQLGISAAKRMGREVRFFFDGVEQVETDEDCDD